MTHHTHAHDKHNTPRIRPMKGNVFVRRSKAPEMTKSGLHIPASAKSAQGHMEAVVLAVSSENKLHLTKGDRVIFGKFTGTIIPTDTHGDVDALIIREDDVIAVVDPGVELG